MNLAESPSPSPSSSSGSGDFATLHDSELELASAIDPVPVSSNSAAPSSDDDDKNLEENVAAEMAVEVESLEQNGYASLHLLRTRADTRPLGVTI
jgi:RNA polymerase II C-terminal domain phosphatase-like 3/4